MKSLLLLPVTLLAACASTESYNNEQVRSPCAIGYHEERSYPMTLFKSKDKDAKKESRFNEEISCVPNSDKDKFIQHHNQN